MSQAAIIINVSDQQHGHSNGLSGTHIVPGKQVKEDFGFLVVYPTPEIQDIGNDKTTVHWLKALPLAMDIVGMRSDAAAHGVGVSGNKTKWGLYLCEAEPDISKELEKAIEAEIEFLNENPPDYKQRKDNKTKAIVAVNVEAPEISDMKRELCAEVVRTRSAFEAECRKLVQKYEIQKAKRALLVEDQRLVAEGDRMWARPAEQANINELHRMACTRLGQERPWCYIPQELVDCPGCGVKIKSNILVCPSCNGWLDEGLEELTNMKPKQRAEKMYPNRIEREQVVIK